MLAALLNVPANVGYPLLVVVVGAESGGRSCRGRRASTSSPLSGSSTAAWKACLWMSIAAYTITDLLSC